MIFLRVCFPSVFSPSASIIVLITSDADLDGALLLFGFVQIHSEPLVRRCRDSLLNCIAGASLRLARGRRMCPFQGVSLIEELGICPVKRILRQPKKCGGLLLQFSRAHKGEKPNWVTRSSKLRQICRNGDTN